jgi:peptide-methionine (R)-S-oxide reductase
MHCNYYYSKRIVMTRRSLIKIFAASGVLLWFGSRTSFFKGTLTMAENQGNEPATGPIKLYSFQKKGYIISQKVVKTEAEWKKVLTPEQFNVLRKKGTEMAFTGQYWNHKEQGIYQCAACKSDLFRSETKFDAGTGWPSFWSPIAPENILTGSGSDYFGRELRCARCESHLGDVFNDGPKPTGLRYCMDSVALLFVPSSELR